MGTYRFVFGCEGDCGAMLKLDSRASAVGHTIELLQRLLRFMNNLVNRQIARDAFELLKFRDRFLHKILRVAWFRAFKKTITRRQFDKGTRERFRVAFFSPPDLLPNFVCLPMVPIVEQLHTLSKGL